MLRLLQKSEIVQAKSLERKLEIDEGLKLARRIDNLRKIATEEEKSLEQFRRETTSHIYNEIALLTEQKEVLTQEVIQLLHTREKLLEPLHNEWELVKKQKVKVEEDILELHTKIDAVNEQEEILKEKLLQIEIDTKNIAIEKQSSFKELTEAVKAKKQADLYLQEAMETRIEANSFVATAKANASEKERTFKVREKNIEDKEQELQDLQKELIIERKQLADLRTTLETELKRIKK